MTTGDFGSIVLVSDIETRVMAHLQAWEQTCLAGVERAKGLEPRALPRMKRWSRESELDKLDEQVPPCLLLCSEGQDGEPVRQGDGTYRAAYKMSLGVLCEARNEVEARDLAGLYAAVFTLALTRPGIEGKRGLKLGALALDFLPVDATRTMGAFELPFVIEFDGVLDTSSGPMAPMADPYDVPAALPTVSSTGVSVTRE